MYFGDSLRASNTCISVGQLETTFPEVVVALKTKCVVPTVMPWTTNTDLSKI